MSLTKELLDMWYRGKEEQYIQERKLVMSNLKAVILRLPPSFGLSG